MPRMMTGVEVAALLRLNIKTVRKHIPSHKVGKRVLYAPADVEEILGREGLVAPSSDEDAHPSDPIWPYGVLIEDGPFGRVELPIALVTQRRLSKNGKTETQIIECPRCGKLHEHGAGEGSRAPHCGPEIKDRGDIYILDGSDLPLTPFKKARIRTGRGKSI